MSEADDNLYCGRARHHAVLSAADGPACGPIDHKAMKRACDRRLNTTAAPSVWRRSFKHSKKKPQ